jgi:hypothetical protein
MQIHGRLDNETKGFLHVGHCRRQHALCSWCAGGYGPHWKGGHCSPNATCNADPNVVALLAVISLVLIAYAVPSSCSECAGAWLQLSQVDDEANGEVLTCLASSAPQIGSLLQRPDLIADLHAAEPYAVVSLVVWCCGLPSRCLVSTLEMIGMLRHTTTCRVLQGIASSECAILLQVCTAQLHPEARLSTYTCSNLGGNAAEQRVTYHKFNVSCSCKSGG